MLEPDVEVTTRVFSLLRRDPVVFKAFEVEEHIADGEKDVDVVDA